MVVVVEVVSSSSREAPSRLPSALPLPAYVESSDQSMAASSRHASRTHLPAAPPRHQASALQPAALRIGGRGALPSVGGRVAASPMAKQKRAAATRAAASVSCACGGGVRARAKLQKGDGGGGDDEDGEGVRGMPTRAAAGFKLEAIDSAGRACQ